ncbi:MAG: guanylate kinase [Gammaproteobacteria bacterium]|nr:guanylate kinase [Gammaproteobacteria bacterium]
MTSNTTGRLFVISAPSGAGKTTLVNKLMAADSDLRFSVSYTTRQQRHNEVDGHDYNFINKERFQKMVADNAFLEHAEVFDNFYGTPRKEVQELLSAGYNVILEIDWQGAEQVRSNMPDCESIFILPPSVIELTQRLRGRATDSNAVITRRLADSLADLTHWVDFDYAVINDQLDQAVTALQNILAGDGTQQKTSSKTIKNAAKQLLN